MFVAMSNVLRTWYLPRRVHRARSVVAAAAAAATAATAVAAVASGESAAQPVSDSTEGEGESEAKILERWSL